LSLDRNRRRVTYAVTIALGVAFALALMEWQSVLPTRITKGIDAFWNVAGCISGAVLAHARKRVRIRFE
jgi:VanZ family protein